MFLFFWDIDGTLIRTDRAGLYALQEATADIFGQQPDFSGITLGGCTDAYLASHLIETFTKRPAKTQEVAALIARYEELLPRHLAERTGHILPFVKEILDQLHDHPDCHLLLLTGNSREGARIKLAHFQLEHYFDFAASGFGNHHPDRSLLASAALETAQTIYSPALWQDHFVIGDTPNDIKCGKFINARTIAVATGRFPISDLAVHSPWLTFSQLPNPQEFFEQLKIPANKSTDRNTTRK